MVWFGLDHGCCSYLNFSAFYIREYEQYQTAPVVLVSMKLATLAELPRRRLSASVECSRLAVASIGSGA